MYRKGRGFAVVLLCALALCGCYKKVNIREVIGTDRMKVEPYRATYVIDHNDCGQITTYASYVFVATVTDYERTFYRNNYPDQPVTVYRLRVKENIKGSLRKDTDVVLEKAGGLRLGTDRFLISEGDILPEPGKTYLFSAVILDGELYCPMPNMVIPVENPEDIDGDTDVITFRELCKDPVPEVPNGNQYKSKYDSGEEQ